MHRRILPIAISLLALASSASAQGRAEALLSDAPQPEGRRCSVPRRLSEVQQQLVDTAALRGAIAAEAGLPAGGSVLYSVRVGEDGSVAWVRPIETGLAPEAEARVQALVRASLRGARSPEPWHLRVRVALGAAPEVRVGRSEVCPAVRAESSASREPGVVASVITTRERAELRGAGPVEVRVRVGLAGEVLEVRLERSSGSRLQDEFTMDAARRSGRYLPELVDGIPVEGWYSITTRVR
jgi:outer membrane biosynthesis protein TonB